MKFADLHDVQSLLDKTVTTEDRLQTSLILLNSKFSELNSLVSGLRNFSERYVEQNTDPSSIDKQCSDFSKEI